MARISGIEPHRVVVLSEIVHFRLDRPRRVQIRHDLQHEKIYRVVFGLLIQHDNPENHMPYSLFDL